MRMHVRDIGSTQKLPQYVEHIAIPEIAETEEKRSEILSAQLTGEVKIGTD